MEDGRGDSGEVAASRLGWTGRSMDMEKAVGGDGNGDVGGSRKPPTTGILRLFLACMVSGGIQYGWALQLSLLSPYSQTLGIPHNLVSLTWICGPIAGFVVQPVVGYYSDRCTAKMGRRRPFILAGCIIICLSVLMIGFSADIGRRIGDTKEHCSTYTGARMFAAGVYIVGFWFLDFANNSVQGPARAMMADLSAEAQYGPNVGQAIFSLWMALGSVLGYLSGANAKWHEWFPILKTTACCDACANLKGAFLTAVVNPDHHQYDGHPVARQRGAARQEQHRQIRQPRVLLRVRGPLQQPQEPASFHVQSAGRHGRHLALVVPLHPVQHRLDGPGDLPRHAAGHPRQGGRLQRRRPRGRHRPALLLPRPRRHVVPHPQAVPEAHVQGRLVHQQPDGVRRHGRLGRPRLGRDQGIQRCLHRQPLRARQNSQEPRARRLRVHWHPAGRSLQCPMGRRVRGCHRRRRWTRSHHWRPQHRHRRPTAADLAHHRPHRRRLQQGQHPGLRHRRCLRTHLLCPGGRPSPQDARGVRHRRHGRRALISCSQDWAERRQLDLEFSSSSFSRLNSTTNISSLVGETGYIRSS